MLYRPNSENETPVQSFVRDFQHRYEAGKQIQMVSLDTREGAGMASLYGVTQYPAILVLDNNGVMINFWQGMPLPLMDEVAGYAHSASG